MDDSSSFDAIRQPWQFDDSHGQCYIVAGHEVQIFSENLFGLIDAVHNPTLDYRGAENRRIVRQVQ